MSHQNFNGDNLEMKFCGAFDAVFDDIKSALTQFIEECYGAKALGYTLYDSGAAVLDGVVARDVFADYYDDIFRQFPYGGTFESYLFILKRIFGEQAEISFEILASAALRINIKSDKNAFFKWVESILSETAISDENGNVIHFRWALGDMDYYKVWSVLNIFKNPGVYLEFNIILKEEE